MSGVMQCEPCGKTFTGPVSYNQHLESEKHKKKVLSLGFQNGSSRTDVQAVSTIAMTPQLSLYACPVCEVAFNSLRNFQTHSLSPEHAQKVMEKNSGTNTESNTVSSSSGILNSEDNSAENNIFGDSNDGILPANEMIKSQTLSFSSCSICNKFFSGPEPYKQHMESAAHTKKAEIKKNASDGRINALAPFSCDPCKKIFSGQVPYVQHIESEIHQKKVRSLQFLEKSTTEVDSVSGSKESKAEENTLKEKTQNIPWFCNICDIQCSGMVPYKQHLEGITHLKKVTKARRENPNFKPEDLIRLPLQNSNENENILNASYLVNGTNRGLNNNYVNMTTDYILPGLIEHLNIMSPEELDKSIKIFSPSDNINFDKSDSKMIVDSGDETIHNASEEVHVEAHEISKINQECYGNNECNILDDVLADDTKENVDVYQVCHLCNVNLLSKDEAANHYESLEHFSRRWKSH